MIVCIIVPSTPYLGFIEVMVSPDLDLTNSLLMNSPLGCVYLRPFGAVSSTNRSDMLVPAEKLLQKVLRGVFKFLKCAACRVTEAKERGDALRQAE